MRDSGASAGFEGMEGSDGAAAGRREGGAGEQRGARPAGASGGVWGTVVLVQLLGLACCLPATAGLNCLQRNSSNATAAGVTATCSAAATFCYAVTVSSGGTTSFGMPPNSSFPATLTAQGCYTSNLTAYNLTCPHVGTASLLSVVGGANYTYTCCNTTDCNNLANATAANRTLAETGSAVNAEDPERFLFLDTNTVPDVPARPLSPLEIALLAILGSFGFIGGILVDLAALSKFPFSDN